MKRQTEKQREKEYNLAKSKMDSLKSIVEKIQPYIAPITELIQPYCVSLMKTSSLYKTAISCIFSAFVTLATLGSLMC